MLVQRPTFLDKVTVEVSNKGFVELATGNVVSLKQVWNRTSDQSAPGSSAGTYAEPLS